MFVRFTAVNLPDWGRTLPWLSLSSDSVLGPVIFRVLGLKDYFLGEKKSENSLGLGRVYDIKS